MVLGAISEAYSDTGLAARTTNFYRVSAYNPNGSSGYATANATTDAPPPPPNAPTGLTWSGADPVDIYRDGNLIASSVDSSTYTDATGNKGGATYSQQVGEAGGTTVCSNTTTTIF